MSGRSVAFADGGLEGYDLEGFVRPGRYGDLWTARRRSDGARVDVKLLRPELFKDGEAIRRFQREVRLLMSLEHPNLLQVIEHGRTRTGDPFLVLEHRDGARLSDVVARGPLPVDAVRSIGAQVAQFLSAAAARGIVHRGLCPAAILVCPDGASKVVDLGLSFAADLDDAEEVDVLTTHGQRLGDPAYMAPEYIEAFRSDERSDVYALGAMVYELLVGDPPFVGAAGDVLDAHVLRDPVPPNEANPAVPAWLSALTLAMLAKAPDARPAADRIARALVDGRWP